MKKSIILIMELEKKLAESLIFESQDEEQEYFKYVKIKGYDLYQHVVSVFSSMKNNQKPKYAHVSSLIRYDKSLRDLLYLYLATFEEYLRAQICSVLDVPPTSKSTFKISDETIYVAREAEISTLYKTINKRPLQLGDLIQIIKTNHKEFPEVKMEDLENVRSLRNQTMHHALLLIGTQYEYDGVKDNIASLREQIKSLSALLPPSYQNGFKEQLNHLLKTEMSSFTPINLGSI